MHEANHIPIERMRDVATKCDALFTDTERRHIEECEACLITFGRILMPDEDDDKTKK